MPTEALCEVNGVPLIASTSGFFSDMMNPNPRFGDSLGTVKIPTQVIEKYSASQIAQALDEAAALVDVVSFEEQVDTFGDVNGRVNPNHVSLMESYMDLSSTAKSHLSDEAREAISEIRDAMRDEADLSPTEEGYVYLAKMDTGHHKIGYSVKPFERIKHFDTQMPVSVELAYKFPTDNPVMAEKMLHRRYDEYRVNGEWFELPKEALQEIRSIEEYFAGEFKYTE